MTKHILVLGSGSVGRRHMRNLNSLGMEISAMDPRRDRLEEAGKEVSLKYQHTNRESCLKEKENYDGLVVASPPCFHIEQAIWGIEQKLPILMEKPLSQGLNDCLFLKQSSHKHAWEKNIIMGYSYRWWKPLRELFTQIRENKIGKIYYAHFTMSAHLADWHPWEPYQEFFMASKELGGGALLDESHFIDLMLWFFGRPRSLFAKVEKLSSLEIETDDNVNIFAVYDSGLRINIHLDLLGRPHEKSVFLVGEKGTLKWSFEPNEISYSKSIENRWEKQIFTCERNDMFMNTAKEFVSLLNGEEVATCSLDDGIQVLEIIEACRKSSREERMVQID